MNPGAKVHALFGIDKKEQQKGAKMITLKGAIKINAQS